MPEYIQAKSILSKLRHKDPWFGIAYNMNLYRGCQHGCIYCDTRSECYGVGDISKIRIKENAIELLRKELKSKQRSRDTVSTGSMNDPYMPLEKKMGTTRKALQVLGEYKFPIHIITKSDLVMRDTDILQDISKTYAAVSFSITCGNDALAKKIEPHAPSTTARLKAIEALAKNGIYTGVTLMPLLPFINDNRENVEDIVRRAKDAGASYILPMFGVTLRKGSRDYFFKELDRSFPRMKEKYVSAYGDQYICNSPDIRNLDRFFTTLARELKIASQMRFYVPPKVNEQLSLF